MQQLYLLRHARPEPWSPLGNDFSRPLSDQGKRHAQALAAWAAGALPLPDTVLCSPSKRTRETLAPLLAQWPQLLATTDYVDQIYNASLNMLLTLAGDAFSFSQHLLMVGHNPGIGDLLINLVQADEAAKIQGMAPGTLAVVGFQDGFKCTPATGRLLNLVKRGDLPL